MSPMDPGVPPKAPDVAQQQGGGDLAQYAEKAQQAAGAGQQQPSGMQLIEKLLNDVSESLSKMAQVAQMTDPIYVEYIKKMAQVGSEFMKDVQASKQKQAQGPGPQAGLDPSRGAEGSANALAA